MRLLIATDAWYPQVNGVVRTLSETADCLRANGVTVEFITPAKHRTFGLPSYPEIRLAFPTQRSVQAVVDGFNPDSIHIATEGPIGRAVRKYCLKHNLPFTSSYHTRFPEYVAARLPFQGVKALAYRVMRAFHAPSRCVLAPTQAITDDLVRHGFNNVKTWTRGVDHARFTPLRCDGGKAYPRPVMVHVGRLAVEKGVEDFLKADVPGTKLVVGDGPQRAELERKYPKAIFTGYLFKDDLVQALCNGDVFVFPSRTDTFGLVMVEAMACGLPVAAYPVPGPIDVVEHAVSGWLDENLSVAITRAQRLPRDAAIARAPQFTWEETAQQMQKALVTFDRTVPAAASKKSSERLINETGTSTGGSR
ncbi:MAG: glycosyltransferase family 1 protein [Pseudomonadota bacterium]